MLLTVLALLAANMPAQDAVQDAPVVVAEEYGPYFVFFGFDSSEVDRDGSDILARVAEEFSASGTRRVVLTGHTDRAGASDYNKRLSRRRVEEVRAKLTDMGIAAERIEIGPDGEGTPLIATADGVREAQNRRVEIHFR